MTPKKLNFNILPSSSENESDSPCSSENESEDNTEDHVDKGVPDLSTHILAESAHKAEDQGDTHKSPNDDHEEKPPRLIVAKSEVKQEPKVCADQSNKKRKLTVGEAAMEILLDHSTLEPPLKKRRN